MSLKFKGILTKGLSKKLRDFAHKCSVEHKSFVTQNSFPLHALVKRSDAEDITNKKTQSIDQPIEINDVTSKLEC